MYKIRLTTDIKQLLTSLLNNPVFSEFITKYEIDDEYLYIPESRIKENPQILNLLKLKIAS